MNTENTNTIEVFNKKALIDCNNLLGKLNLKREPQERIKELEVTENETFKCYNQIDLYLNSYLLSTDDEEKLNDIKFDLAKAQNKIRIFINSIKSI